MENSETNVQGPVKMMSATRACSAATAGTETKFVEADAYCRLLTSRRCLERMDDPVQGLRGVFDPVKGVYYVVEERKLFRLQVTARLATT